MPFSGSSTNHRMQEHIAEEQGLVGKYPISVEVLRREIPLTATAESRDLP